jgi:hypothetical protein
MATSFDDPVVRESDMPGTSTTSAFAVMAEILFVSRVRAMQ